MSKQHFSKKSGINPLIIEESCLENPNNTIWMLLMKFMNFIHWICIRKKELNQSSVKGNWFWINK